VLRRQVYPNGSKIDGADLYLDNYYYYYYSPTLAGLPAAIREGETVNNGASDAQAPDIAAAEQAFDGPIDQVRQRMAIADPNPGVKPKMIAPATSAPMARALKQRILRHKETGPQYPPASPEILEGGMIWDNCIDALLAGTGNPDVRAGGLHLLGTIPQVSVGQGTLNGQPTLVLIASVFVPPGYQEELIVNASTGVPMEMVGDVSGQQPTVTVTYEITRVTAAAIEAEG
jgi:hypothetical protein